MASIKKYQTAKGETRYRVMWREGLKQKSVSKKRWKDANDFKIQIEHSQRTGDYVQPIKISVEKHITEWISIHSQGLAYRTGESYNYLIQYHIIPYIGHIELQKLNAGHINSLYKTLSKTKSSRTVRYIHTVLKMALSAAIKYRYIRFNPCDAVTPPKSLPTIKPVALQPDEIQKYISAFNGTWIYPGILLGAICGLRKGEILALRWKDVKFKENYICVNGSIYIRDGKRDRKTTKSGKERIIYISDILVDILKSYRDKQIENKNLLQSDYKESEYVIREDNGALPRPDYFWRFYSRRLKSKGLPHIRVQDLRHTAGSLMIYEGDDLQTVSDNLGHHSAAFTAKTYIHSINDAKIKSAKHMEKYLKND